MSEDDDKKKDNGFDLSAAVTRANKFLSTAVEHTYNAFENYGPSVTSFGFITKPSKEAMDKIDEVMYSASEKLNTGLPSPIPSLCRSHSAQLVLTTSVASGLITAIPMRRISGGGFFKTFIYMGVLTGTVVGSTSELIKYKWNYPRK